MLEALDRIVWQLGIQRLVGGVRSDYGAERIAVGCCFRHHVDGEYAVGAGAVIDDERLAETLGEFDGSDARDQISDAARRVRDQYAHRPGRVVLGL